MLISILLPVHVIKTLCRFVHGNSALDKAPENTPKQSVITGS